MSVLDQLLTVLTKTCQFLNQNDVLSLAQTSRSIHDQLAIEQLYRNVIITKDPVCRSDAWFLDGDKSYLSGYRALKKSADQNDLFLYDRIERFIESPHLKYVKTLVIQDRVFADSETGNLLLRQLLDKIISLDVIEDLEIRDKTLFDEFYDEILNLSHLTKIKILDLKSLEKTKSLSSLETLEWVCDSREISHLQLSPKVKEMLSVSLRKAELIIDHANCSSLPLFSYLQSQGVKCHSLRSLKFNHLHEVNSHDKHIQEQDIAHLEEVVNLGKLEQLELGLSCEDIGCGCIDEFLMELAPHLTSLNKLGLIERTIVETSDHKVKEDWDITICKFILHIPHVGSNLKELSVRHQTPLNGLSDDSVHGNYFRRRTLYETVLPKLKALQTLMAPTMLQSLSAYEVIVCDLLWNGCQCNYCKKVLPIFDQYIMNHQYYSKESGRYMDVIPTVFFAYAGHFLTHNFLGQSSWDLSTFNFPPSSRAWNLHGYEALHHFENYECLFDESTFGPLAVVITHFFDEYMDSLVQMLPNLRRALFSGIYYAVDSDSHTYETMYT